MLGKLIVDIAGTELNQIEKKYLSHDDAGAGRPGPRDLTLNLDSRGAPAAC